MNLKNAIVDKITTMKDKSIKITLLTRELPPTELAKLFLSLNTEAMNIELPEETGDSKTPSQRLRAVLYRLWEQEGKERFSTFSLYYNHILEQIINGYKDRLE